MILVFTYGSLMRGLHNHILLEYHGAEFVTEWVTETASYDMLSMDDSYPIVIPGKYHIYGEIYQITERCLKDLDRLEGHPLMYQRKSFHINELNLDVYYYDGSSLADVCLEDSVKILTEYDADRQAHVKFWNP